MLKKVIIIIFLFTLLKCQSTWSKGYGLGFTGDFIEKEVTDGILIYGINKIEPSEVWDLEVSKLSKDGVTVLWVRRYTIFGTGITSGEGFIEHNGFYYILAYIETPVKYRIFVLEGQFGTLINEYETDKQTSLSSIQKLGNHMIISGWTDVSGVASPTIAKISLTDLSTTWTFNLMMNGFVNLPMYAYVDFSEEGEGVFFMNANMLLGEIMEAFMCSLYIEVAEDGTGIRYRYGKIRTDLGIFFFFVTSEDSRCSEEGYCLAVSRIDSELYVITDQKASELCLFNETQTGDNNIGCKTFEGISLKHAAVDETTGVFHVVGYYGTIAKLVILSFHPSNFDKILAIQIDDGFGYGHMIKPSSEGDGFFLVFSRNGIDKDTGDEVMIHSLDFNWIYDEILDPSPVFSPTISERIKNITCDTDSVSLLTLIEPAITVMTLTDGDLGYTFDYTNINLVPVLTDNAFVGSTSREVTNEGCFTCFGISASQESSVCSSRGNCTAPGTCECDPLTKYIGEKCDVPITCFGEPFYSPDSCSGEERGSCEDLNTCSCASNYFGCNCNVSTCFGTFSNISDVVCNGEGECVDLDDCRCNDNDNYYGVNCNITKCYGLFSNDSETVCSTHGDCVALNYCECDDHYYGFDCSVTTCFEQFSNDSLNSCSSHHHGNCTDYNNCQCFDEFYFGDDCSVNICFGKFSNDSEVCSTNGNCTDFNLCECYNSEYFGANCSINSCFGILSNESSGGINICSSHGDCIDFNDCKCVDDYYGDYCNITKCNGLFSNDSDSVCSSHGDCVAPNFCECDDDYFGFDCSINFCFGYLSNISEVCNSNGNCTDFNFCECVGSWNGKNCSNSTTIVSDQDDDDDDDQDDVIHNNNNNDDNNTSDDNVLVLLFSILGSLGIGAMLLLCCCCFCCVIFFLLILVFTILIVGFSIIIGPLIPCCSCSSTIGYLFYSKNKDTMNNLKLFKTGSFLDQINLGKGKNKKKDKVEEYELARIIEQNDKNRKKQKSAVISIKEEFIEIAFKDLEVIQSIGSGGSDCQIFLCRWIQGNIPVAFKCFNTKLLNAENNFKSFERETRIMASIRHPNLLVFYGACIYPPRVGIIMEYCEKGDLRKFLIKNNEYPFEDRIRILSQVCDGMSYLHEKGVIHRDLKPENILVSDHEDAKIMDFGLSRIIDNNKSNLTKTKNVGTSYYMAPEMILSNLYDERCDIFSFSVVIWEVIANDFDCPYSLDNYFSIERKVAYEGLRPPINKEEFSEEILDEYNHIILLLQRMWDQDPSERPDFRRVKEILELPGKSKLDIDYDATYMRYFDFENFVSIEREKGSTFEITSDDDSNINLNKKEIVKNIGYLKMSNSNEKIALEEEEEEEEDDIVNLKDPKNDDLLIFESVENVVYNTNEVINIEGVDNKEIEESDEDSDEISNVVFVED